MVLTIRGMRLLALSLTNMQRYGILDLVIPEYLTEHLNLQTHKL